jgi:hypothetical protein
VANSGFSLREGIMHLQSALDAIDGLTDSSLQKLIEFVAEYGALTQAGIVGITADRIDTTRVLAHIGESFPIDENEPVLKAALGSGELAAVNLITENVADQNQLLAAIPMADSTGEIHAMLLVRSMPFFAFHENNLKLIAVLVAHGVDHLRFGGATSSIARFIASFERLSQDFKEFELDTMLLKVSGARADVMAAYEKLRSSIRAIDMICIINDKSEPVIWIMLPLTTTAEAQAWMQRMDGVLARVTAELVAIHEINPQKIRSLEPHQ